VSDVAETIDEARRRFLERAALTIAALAKPIVDRTFAIDFLDAGVETFAFTFG